MAWRYFQTMGIPLRSGRYFNERDLEGAAPVLMINEAMARRYWPNEDALGRRITFSDKPKPADWLTIVGITGDVKDKPESSGAEPAFWYRDVATAICADLEARSGRGA